MKAFELILILTLLFLILTSFERIVSIRFDLITDQWRLSSEALEKSNRILKLSKETVDRCNEIVEVVDYNAIELRTQCLLF